jgi:GNAT superfamily N-acetyltransferase
MIAGIQFERAPEAEVLAARELFERVFGGPASPEGWRRKYVENPAGAVVAFAARDGGRLVGFVGLHPSAFWVGGERVTLYQAGDVMTDPAYRRRGILTELKVLAAKWLRGHGAPFAISFPSTAVYELHKKTGHTFVGRLQRWVKPLAAGGKKLGGGGNSSASGGRRSSRGGSRSAARRRRGSRPREGRKDTSSRSGRRAACGLGIW